MDSRWSDADADFFAEEARRDGHDPLLGLRIYTSRLIGQDHDLVLHGGGNTSVKVTAADGTRLMHIKGSGWDLDSIAAPGLPAVRLAELLESRDGPALSDPQMVALLRKNLIDDSAPNPSVEALLHAFIDHDFVDHTHSSAVLALANQADMRARVAELYGSRVAFVPYVMPGYDLSIEGAKIYDAHPRCEGLWLENHGLFTFGPDARTSYERMVEFVTIAEAELARNGADLPLDQPTDRPAPVELLDTLTRELDRRAATGNHQWDFRSTRAVRDYVALSNLEELAHRGTATPDHVIRIKPFPLLLSADDNAAAVGEALDAYAARYAAYFERNAAQANEPKTMLDTLPRVVLIRDHGIAGLAGNAKAAGIAADLAEQTCRIVQSAERYGAFRPLQERDLFDMEYWSLEQAKLKPTTTV